MALFPTGGSRSNFQVDNFGANPSANIGTSVIPGTSGAEGAATQLLTATAQDALGFYVFVSNGSTTTAIKSHLLDIGIDPAGGTAYVWEISNIVCGQSAGAPSCGWSFFFPMRIKAGSTVAARVQGSNATPGTLRVAIRLYGQHASPENVPTGTFSETIGTITGTQGVTFTPGNAADGTYVSLGTTVKAMWWWQIGVQISQATLSANNTYVELAWGDATNKQTITRVQVSTSTAEAEGNLLPVSLFDCFCPVPAGSTIYIRGRCSGAPDSGYNGVAIGIGG